MMLVILMSERYEWLVQFSSVLLLPLRFISENSYFYRVSAAGSLAKFRC